MEEVFSFLLDGFPDKHINIKWLAAAKVSNTEKINIKELKNIDEDYFARE